VPNGRTSASSAKRLFLCSGYRPDSFSRLYERVVAKGWRMSGIKAGCCVLVMSALGVWGCTPGYMNADKLNNREQGPTHCAARCHELGMEMGALVLVGDQLPGCVCQPYGSDGSVEGASAASTSYVVLAAAASARAQQRQQQHQQHPYKP
jgi:hypothetical protein